MYAYMARTHEDGLEPVLVAYYLQTYNSHDISVLKEKLVPSIMELFQIPGSGVGEAEGVDPAGTNILKAHLLQHINR